MTVSIIKKTKIQTPKRPSIKELLTKKEGFLCISFGYSQEYVFPYKDGLKIMALWKHAEKIDTDDLSSPVITPIRHDRTPEIKMISQQEYLSMKMTKLMGTKIVIDL